MLFSGCPTGVSVCTCIDPHRAGERAQSALSIFKSTVQISKTMNTKKKFLSTLWVLHSDQREGRRQRQ